MVFLFLDWSCHILLIVVSYSLVFSVVVLVSRLNYMDSDYAWCPYLSQYTDYNPFFCQMNYALSNITIHIKTTGCRVLVYVFYDYKAYCLTSHLCCYSTVLHFVSNYMCFWASFTSFFFCFGVSLFLIYVPIEFYR